MVGAMGPPAIHAPTAPRNDLAVRHGDRQVAARDAPDHHHGHEHVPQEPAVGLGHVPLLQPPCADRGDGVVRELRALVEVDRSLEDDDGCRVARIAEEPVELPDRPSVAARRRGADRLRRPDRPHRLGGLDREAHATALLSNPTVSTVASRSSARRDRVSPRCTLPLVVRGSVPLRMSATPSSGSMYSSATERRTCSANPPSSSAGTRAEVDLGDEPDLGLRDRALERGAEASGMQERTAAVALEVLRIEVAPADDDEVLEPSGDHELAVDERAEVARAQVRPSPDSSPAMVAPKISAVSSRTVPVPLGDARTAHEDLADRAGGRASRPDAGRRSRSRGRRPADRTTRARRRAARSSAGTQLAALEPVRVGRDRGHRIVAHARRDEQRGLGHAVRRA